jgi:hypothetical protein
MALCNMPTKLALCFELLEKTAWFPQLQGLTAVEVLQMVTGINLFKCPHCKLGRMHLIPIGSGIKQYSGPG